MFFIVSLMSSYLDSTQQAFIYHFHPDIELCVKLMFQDNTYIANSNTFIVISYLNIHLLRLNKQYFYFDKGYTNLFLTKAMIDEIKCTFALCFFYQKTLKDGDMKVT